MANVAVLPRSARTIVDEHRALRTLLVQVEEAFSRPSPHSGSGPDVVAARLDALRGSLVAHFEEEERARLFEEIEERAPEHAAACARLRGQHRELTRRLDALRKASPEARRGPTWALEVRSLIDDVSGHEEREAELLRQTLDGSLAAQD